MCVHCDDDWGEGIKPWFFSPNCYVRPLYKQKPLRKREDILEGRYGQMPPEERDLIDLSREAIKAKLEDPDHFIEIRNKATEALHESAGGNIVTLDEALKIIDLAWPLQMQSCRCRRWYAGVEERSKEEYTCLALTPGTYKWGKWPEMFRGGTAFTTPEETKEWFKKMDKEGFVHLVGTVGDPPKIYGMCNCDTSSCIALRQLRTYGIKRNLEGHFVADLDWDACNGCGECVKRCQFSALMLSPKEKKVVHDKFSCYGCGLCVSVCPVQAFSMVPRETFPALLETWGKPKV